MRTGEQVEPATEQIERCLRRIEQLDPQLCAAITVMAEEARAAAVRCDEAAAEGRWLGLLHGMPVAIKDNIDTAGVRTTSGSTFFRERVPDTDAFVVRKLKAAGAIPLVKANLAEFAFGATSQNPHYGPCRNPWDPARIPGGSSGGSAVAVAAEMAVGALGTDTGGSVRIPAAANGVVGLRPTLGRVSNGGVTPVSVNFDTVGPMARRAVDVARLLAAIEGYDPEDVTSIRGPADEVIRSLDQGVEGLRIGVPTRFFFDGVDPQIEAAVRAGIDELERQGASVHEIVVKGAEEAQRRMQQMVYPDAAAFHEQRMAEAAGSFGSDVYARLQLGPQTTSLEYARAVAWRHRWLRDLELCFQEVDVIATPTVAVPPPLAENADTLLATHPVTTLTYCWSMGNLPAVSVPCGFADDLPVGLQLAGRPWEDGLILRVAAAYQSATDWHTRRPTVLG